MTKVMENNIMSMLRQSQAVAIIKQIEGKNMPIYRIELLSMKDKGYKHNDLICVIKKETGQKVTKQEISKWIHEGKRPSNEILEFFEKRYMQRFINNIENHKT